jgi:hypothetical protein
MNCKTITISDLRQMHANKQLELSPPYQRRPVWKTKDRKLLLSSIFYGMPVPAIILHKRFDLKKKKNIYDVLDGKQRIETILHFIEVLSIEGEEDWLIRVKKNSEEVLDITFNELKSKRFNKENKNLTDKFWNYTLPVIEFEGELVDFFENPIPSKDIFVRINSTGSALKKNEIRHANHNVLFFKLGEQLEKSYVNRFQHSWRIFSNAEVQRYLFHEFLLELCTAIHFNKYTDRRKKLDELLTNYSWSSKETDAISKRFGQIITWIKSIFPDHVFINTRFKNKSDFYSLFVVLNDLIEKKFVTTNLKDNRILGNTLLEFSKAAQDVSAQLRKYDLNNNWKGHDKEMIKYVIATRESTDSISNRQLRNDFIQTLLKGFILKQKDKKRLFDPNVKGVLWTRQLQRFQIPKCPNPTGNKSCKKVLNYDDAQIDHIFPWSKGGPSTLKNAQLICSSCNKVKGATF